MKLVSLFSTPLFVDYLDIDNTPLINFCYEYQQNNPSRKEISGYQSLNLDLKNSVLSILAEKINLRINEIKKDYFSFKPEISLSITNSWFNINYPQGGCLGPATPHLHPHRLLSCVYYLSAESNSGDLILLSPHNAIEYAIPNQTKNQVHDYNSNKWHLNPEPGKLVIFPGWISHYVESNLSNKDRISMVLNYSFDNLEDIVNTVY
jgi:uncharacterized protein (TIGR02466 family)